MNNAERQGLDIVIPVYDEGANIVPTLRAIAREVTTPNRILICYDHEDDNTLPVINGSRDQFNALTILFVRNHGWRKQYRTLSPPPSPSRQASPRCSHHRQGIRERKAPRLSKSW